MVLEKGKSIPNQIDIHGLRQTIVVAEHLSFRRAAEALGIRQSSVSRRIRRLEEAIGTSLFERHFGGLRVTYAGQAFIRDVRHVMTLLDQAIARADRSGRVEAGLLTLGFFPSLISGRLRGVLEQFRRISPGVLVETLEGSPVDQLGWLRSRRVDAGLLAGGYEAPDLERLPLWEERIFAALPHDHEFAAAQALQWQDLRRERWVVCTLDSDAVDYNFLIGRIATDGHIPATSLHLTSWGNILGLVGAGYGVTIVPETLVGLNFPGVVFRPITGEGALLPISAAWLGNNDNPALRRFLNLLRQLQTPPPA